MKNSENLGLRAVDAVEREKDAVAGEKDAPEAGNKAPMPHRRSIYLLPNIITTGALFAGFYATIAGMNGRFEAAALAILAAIILDAADGRIARLTRTQSKFGAEYDSLSDMVAFGVAPAFVVFSWGLSSLGQIGWMLAFLYIACTALPKRLGLKGRVPFVALVLVVLSFAVLLADPPLILLLLSVGYALSAPAQFAWRWLRQRNSA